MPLRFFTEQLNSRFTSSDWKSWITNTLSLVWSPWLSNSSLPMHAHTHTHFDDVTPTYVNIQSEREHVYSPMTTWWITCWCWRNDGGLDVPLEASHPPSTTSTHWSPGGGTVLCRPDGQQILREVLSTLTSRMCLIALWMVSVSVDLRTLTGKAGSGLRRRMLGSLGTEIWAERTQSLSVLCTWPLVMK